MKENFRKAWPQLKRLMIAGLTGHGVMYAIYLIVAASLAGFIVYKQRYGMQVGWLFCRPSYYGLLHSLCQIQGWLFPMILGVFVGLCAFILSILGAGCFDLKRILKLVKCQKAFEFVDLKNSQSEYPTVIDLNEKKNGSEWLTVKARGLGIDKFQQRKKDLESALGLSIDTIEQGLNPSIIRLSLYSSAIPRLCEYQKMIEALSLPYSFLVGQSAREVVVQCLLALPHLLIAGTTGGGKSIFFKQVLIGLLTSSPRIQMYLFDLKGGVEMNVFSKLPNVEVYKNISDAVTALKMINSEMDRRLAYLTAHGFSKVDFERDKLDMIVIGVDEASELYGLTSDKKEQKIVDQAREYTDRITKLARATGIHVILATQKVLKETIDTKVQENIGGRMVFRMNTMPGSMNVLGNKMAFEIPAVPGRAIWSCGNDFIEVQAPFLSEPDLKASLQQIEQDFTDGGRKNFAPIVSIMKQAPGMDTEPQDISMFKMKDHGAAD